ncbi:MAG: carboxymethylenebutenolidase [Candidatus Binatia bacterium]|nr:MAG: carboxymethylenebutenolidase [Candidatus Binatia bacterium]
MAEIRRDKRVPRGSSRQDPTHPLLSRRRFLARTLAAGFALAVRPIAASTIRTGTAGLREGEVSFSSGGTRIPAYRALPEGAGPFPVVLLVHEIFGLHEYVRDVARRLAREGYYALAPDLFARQGDPRRLASIPEIVEKIVRRVPDAQVLSDLDAAVAWLDGLPEARTASLGITGFCWGGRIVWLYAAHSERLDAGVAWYGRLVGEPSDTTPKHPVDVVGALRAPVLGLYGGKDPGIPLETVDRMREELRKFAKPSEIVVYPEAPHGFHADYRPSYRKEAAEDGWRKMLDWFRKHGVG